jgi:hypothetical protein
MVAECSSPDEPDAGGATVVRSVRCPGHEGHPESTGDHGQLAADRAGDVPRVGGESGGPAAPDDLIVVVVLAVDSRAAVDDLVARAASAGGTSSRPAQVDEVSYTGSFTDPDGHVWQVTAMEPVHVID